MEALQKYEFEWDPVKARRNLRKHHISFDRAVTVFLDPMALSLVDTQHSAQEERWITLGLDRTGTLLVVCHTFRQEGARNAWIRIISARKATRNEIDGYGEKKS